MTRVYIAGCYSRSPKTGKEANILEIFQNIKIGKDMASYLFSRGYAVYCPFQDYDFILHGYLGEFDIEMFRKNSMAWLEVSNAVYMLPGWQKSGGAIKEKNRALSLQIPVFYEFPILINKLKI